jgi:hypothetical protein
LTTSDLAPGDINCVDAGSGRSVFELVERQYAAAADRALHRKVLDFPPAVSLVAACGRIFASLEREDEFQRRVARSVWLIKSAVLQTFLPFDDARLSIKASAEELIRVANTLPAIRADAAIVASILDSLTASAVNPKREWFLRELGHGPSRRITTAVFAGLQGAGTPGWPVDLDPASEPGLIGIPMIRTRKDCRKLVFDRVVIPGTTRFAAKSLVLDLLYGGRAREVVVLTYRGERAFLPEPIQLPTDNVFASRADARSDMVEVEVEAEVVDSQLDAWATSSMWQAIRAQHVDMNPVSDRDVTVSARFVLFADGSGTFLPEDRRVVEISHLFDEGADAAPSDDQLPRKQVRDLEEGDLVLLRIAGGGHYVEDVADDLMAKAGLRDLRRAATDWKEALSRVLKKRGDGYVARAARDIGLRIRNASYLWQWAGDAVMAPHDFETFLALIRAIARLDPTENLGKTDEYAQARWRQMEQVKSFHMRAGVVIRNALLERVKQLLAERASIATVLSVELPGLAAGRMGLLRVSAVDAKPMPVPLSRLFHVLPVQTF